jgi:hypothetical protein
MYDKYILNHCACCITKGWSMNIEFEGVDSSRLRYDVFYNCTQLPKFRRCWLPTPSGSKIFTQEDILEAESLALVILQDLIHWKVWNVCSVAVTVSNPAKRGKVDINVIVCTTLWSPFHFLWPNFSPCTRKFNKFPAQWYPNFSHVYDILRIKTFLVTAMLILTEPTHN